MGEKIKYAHKEGLIPLNTDDNVALKTCQFMNTQFNISANGTIKRYFIEVSISKKNAYICWPFCMSNRDEPIKSHG